MTTAPERARCPACGSVDSIFVYSETHDDLVCQSCREGASLSQETALSTAASSRRNPVGRTRVDRTLMVRLIMPLRVRPTSYRRIP